MRRVGRRWSQFLDQLERRVLLSGTQYPLDALPIIHTNPSASAKLFIDFDGAPAMTWGSYTTTTTPAYDQDGHPTTFSDSEITSIQQIVDRVAEMYSPFQIDVTTEDPGVYSNGQALRVVVGGNGAWESGSDGGISYVGSFYNGSPNTAWVFPANLANGNPKYTAIAVAHEAGHGFGLQHQSTYDPSGNKIDEYNPGDSVRAPIMGLAYYSTRGLWWNGTSTASFRIQDDLSILSGASDGFGYRPDDHGNAIASADTLTQNGLTLSGSGIIEQTTDQDFFGFTIAGGSVSIAGNVATLGAMLDLKLELFDAGGSLIADADTASLGETITSTLAAGTYYVAVASHGGYGDVGQYTLGITLADAGPAPVADAGGPYAADEGGTVALDATQSTGDSLTFAWDLDGDGIFGETGAGALNGNETGPAPTFLANRSGNYAISLRVTDGTGAVSTDSTTITVQNIAPTATITGAPASGTEGTAITLGSDVTDPGSTDTFTYAWSVTKNGNPFATGTSASFSFTPDDNGSYAVSLTVTDNDGGIGTDSATIIITNVAPTPSITGAPAGGPEGSAITLGSSVTDPGSADTFTYAWSVTKNGNPFTSGSAADFTFTPDDNGSYAVSLTVSDDDGGVGTDSATIIITNVAPTPSITGAPAGGPEGSAITLGSSVTDPGSADTFTYAWSVTKDGNPFASGSAADFTFTPDDDGTYAVTLAVTDDDGGVGTNSVTIAISNVAPTASIIGAPSSSPEGTTIDLGSSVSDPGLIDIFTYAWDVTKDGNPFASGSAADFSFTPDGIGTYTVTLTVTDNDGGIGTDTATLVGTNLDPTTSITGAPESSPEGTQITLGSSVTDPGSGDTFTYAWSVARDGNPFASGTDPGFSFTPDDNGSYAVTLTVTDNGGGVSNDSVTIAITNVAPEAAITGAPADGPEGTSINLGSSIVDPGSADTFAYEWSVTKDGSPFASGTAADFSFTPDDNGSYVVSLSVSDDDGGIGTDTTTIDIANVAPVVSITGAPVSSPQGTAVNLGSSIADPGSVDTFTYEWSVTRDGSPFASGAGADFSFTPADVGSYTVSLIASDDDGGVGTESISIAISNVAPTVSITGAPGDGVEGAPITLGSNVTDPGTPNVFTYAWSVTKDGIGYANGSAPGFSFVPNDNGTYLVSLRATDFNGGVGAAVNRKIIVDNLDPVVTITGVPASATEAESLSLTAQVTDFGTADMAAGLATAWTVTRDGTLCASGSGTSITFTPDSAGSYVVSMSATDKDGGIGVDTATILVTNPAPAVSISGPASTTAGVPVTFDSTAETVSADVTAGLDYTWNVMRDGVLVASGSDSALTFSPPTAGTYVISVTATDQTGAAGADTRTLTVAEAALQPLMTSTLLTRTAPQNNASVYYFKVGYRSRIPLLLRSISSGDVMLSGPNRFVQLATLMRSSVISSHAVIATYRVVAPHGRWNTAAPGTYALTLRSRQVFDSARNFLSARRLGLFNIAASASARRISSVARAPVFSRAPAISDTRSDPDWLAA